MSEATMLLKSDRSPFADLAKLGSSPALISGDHSLSYADLAERVLQRSQQLGPERRLIMLGCANDVETVVTYLAALDGGHPVLLTEGNGSDSRRDDLSRLYQPDVIADGDHLQELREGTRHRLHPDLALLMSTSGSTGSPKLVRLSYENVRANAASIAMYLQITSHDRAATTLPLHYCYGLSVLNSHLTAGASVMLTDRSVVEERFWDDFRAGQATSFAGVPYTFDLLDSSGFEHRDLPSLRYVTQAGGRLAPETVRRYARLGRERGFELVVMYGQTEATARMGYLPPHLAEDRPEAIGIPIPGGTFRIDTDGSPGPGGSGELVYTGSNVMLGYATQPADLQAGRTVDELRTGDLARQHEDGIYELVGRSSRFAKVYGLRVDLDHVERLAAEQGVSLRAVEHGGAVVAFVTRHCDIAKIDAVADLCRVPRRALQRQVVASFPLTTSGKTDYASLSRHAAMATHTSRHVGTTRKQVTASAVRDLFAELLGRPDACQHDSFVSLHGDSLSYVEVSIRLQELLGRLPTDWPTRSATELASEAIGHADEEPVRPPTVRMESSTLLRALAIFAIVASHANLITVMGGAHVLLGVMGLNMARLRLTDQPARERVTGLLRAAAQIAVPAALWIAGVGLVTGMYEPSTALMLNNLVGSDDWDVQWQFWFLEAVVWAHVATAGLLMVPGISYLERRQPYRFAVAVLVVTVSVRYLLVGVTAGPVDRYALPVVLWTIALGWLIARSTTTRQRLMTSVLIVASMYGFFDDLQREGLVVLGLLLVTWVPFVPVPRAVSRAIAVVASSSLFVYLTHWQVYPSLEHEAPLAATLLSFVVGISVWQAHGTISRWASSKQRAFWRRPRSSKRPGQIPASGAVHASQVMTESNLCRAATRSA
ncbi:MAG TPA: AMP-binding protein [Nocardioidaceae bacterium]|nr:AMP-binding protein [Nocardioidaceae bacterium]